MHSFYQLRFPISTELAVSMSLDNRGSTAYITQFIAVILVTNGYALFFKSKVIVKKQRLTKNINNK